MRVLAEVTEYDHLLLAFRARADELEMTREEIDRQSGMPDRYASKQLCRPPMKIFGPKSTGPTLGALGLKLLVVEDLEQTQRILARRIPREKPVRPTKETVDGQAPTE